MAHSRNNLQPLDVWKELQPLFENESNENPEVYIVGFQPDEFKACILYFFEASRSVISQFVVPETEIPVQAASPLSVANSLVRGAVSAAIWVEFYTFPPITIYIDQPRELSISYDRQGWTALSVLGLFDFLVKLINLAPAIEIYPDAYYYTVDEQDKFMKIWQQYQHDPS